MNFVTQDRLDDCRQLPNLLMSLWLANQRMEDANKHRRNWSGVQDNIKKLIEPTKIVSQLLSFQIKPRFSELMWHVRQHPTQLLINQVHLTMFKRKITKKYVQCFTETVNKVWSISENTDYNIFWLGLLYTKNIRIITIKHILLTEGSKGSEHSETHVQSLHSITGIKCVFAISHAWLKVYII
jgi:hypothetical protein